MAMQRFLAAIKTLLNAFLAQQQSSNNITKLNQQLTYLTEAESSDASHPIHTLDTRLCVGSERTKRHSENSYLRNG